MRRALIAATGLCLGALSFVVTLAPYTFFNDHFGRISPARQIARYGELPFRDFFDPGFTLTEFASAAMQRLLGDNLLGELLMTSAFIAAGVLCIFVLVRWMTQSTAVAMVASLATLLTAPRGYDYDKALFYPLGLLAIWRYIETRRARELWIVAATVVVAGMFRYDNGLLMAIAALTAIVVAHVHEGSAPLLRRVALFIAACAVCALPYILFLQATAGLGSALEQMVVYALREGANSRLTSPPDVFADATATSLSVAGAAAAVFYLFLVLPLGAVLASRWPRAARPDAARVWSAAVMIWLLAAFILRRPIAAHLGGAVGPAVVIAAWLWRRSARFRYTRVVVALLIVATLARAAEWRMTVARLQRTLPAVPALLADAAASPPAISLIDSRLTGVIGYVRRCTQPDDRIFTTWFVPEVYFFSGRAFAGGIPAVFNGHWSAPGDQHRIVAKLRAESVPIVLFREGDESFSRQYPIVSDYFGERYRPAGSSAFEVPNGDRYTVLTSIDRAPVAIDAASSLPCFARP